MTSRVVVARATGATLLAWRALGIVAALLFEGTLRGGSAANRLTAAIAGAGDLRAATVLTMIYAVGGLVMGLLLYLYTRSSGVELATFGFAGRIAEAAMYGVQTLGIIALYSIATSSTDATAHIDARLVVEIGRSTTRVALVGCFFFAAASAAFAWLLVRGHQPEDVIGT